jgi:hypothetical protein
MGLSIALLAPKKGAPSDEEEAPPSESGESGSAKKFAMLAVQAIKDGDDDAAADALVNMGKACMNYSNEE